MSYEGSVLQGITGLVARKMVDYLPPSTSFTFCLGQPDDAAFTTEAAVIWTQPEDGRYRYEESTFQPDPVQESPLAPWQNYQRGEAILDRRCAVDVLIRAPGSEMRLMQLSDAFHAAMKEELGAPGNQGQAWMHEGRSDGAGGGTDEATWEERFQILVRFSVIQQRYVEGNPLEIVIGADVEVEGSGVFVEGPAQGENVEQVPL